MLRIEFIYLFICILFGQGRQRDKSSSYSAWDGFETHSCVGTTFVQVFEQLIWLEMDAEGSCNMKVVAFNPYPPWGVIRASEGVLCITRHLTVRF